MIVSTCQRWRERRGLYRPAGEPIATRAYEIAAIADDSSARAFVTRHHYSASYPAARRRFGIYRAGGELVGVAVFSVPMHAAALRPLPPEALELGRFVLLDNVPANGETWFLARCFELLRVEGFPGVVSFSDPMPRLDTDGARVFGGHIGTIYQAHNAVYLGQGERRTLRLLASGVVLSARAISKLRSGERGWRYAAGLLEAAGAEPLRESDDRREWARRWTCELTRAQRHPGNHKYVWGLERAARRALPSSQPYPKLGERREAVA